MRSHAGFLDHGVGMVQRLPFDRFTTLHSALVGQGYRPVSVRPYLVGEETHVAAAWVRDGRASKVDLTLSAEQLTDAFDANAGQGWGLDDFARYGDKWAAVWSVSPAPTSPDEVRFYVDKPLDEHLALLDEWGTSEYASPDKPLFWIDKIDIRVPPAEPPLVTALWRPPWCRATRTRPGKLAFRPSMATCTRGSPKPISACRGFLPRRAAR